MSAAVATEMTGTTSRTDEILSAVDHLIAVHDDWERDEKAPPQPSEAFEDALIAAVGVSENGDTPQRCRELATALSRLGFEWNEYAGGKMDRQHRPVGSFWAAFRAVLNAREGASAPSRRTLEPVSELLKQGVSYRQIAEHIYGHRGKGPFLTAAGQPDVTKILQEKDQPGSVVPVGWVHPEDIEEEQRSSTDMKRRLTAIQRRDGDLPDRKSVQVDPASVEQLLREGQYPDVIARVKNVTIESVYNTANQLGIVPNLRPNLADPNYVPEPVKPAAATPLIEDETPAKSEDDIRAEIVAAYGPNADAAAVAESLGVSPQKVRQVWRFHRIKLQEKSSGGTSTAAANPESDHESDLSDDVEDDDESDDMDDSDSGSVDDV